MICPVCRFGNFPGDDTCANCGADLWASDTPQATTSFSGELLGTRLAELAAGKAHSVDMEADLGEAVARMQREGIDCLLVTEGGVLVGIFTDRDAILKVAGRDSAGRTIGDVRTADPVVLRGADPVAVAIHKMAVGGFRHVPIIDQGQAIGVVSARDVFRHLAADLA